MRKTPTSHRWKQQPGPTPSDVDRKVCIHCGMLRMGMRERVYVYLGRYLKTPGECPGRRASVPAKRDAALQEGK